MESFTPIKSQEIVFPENLMVPISFSFN